MKIIINGKTAILRKVILFKFVFENCSVMLRSISVFIIVDILNLLHAVSRSITGCFVQQNIGEVSARTEGLTPTAKKTYEIFPIPLLKTTVPSVSPLLLPQHRGCNPSHSLKFRPTPSDFLPNRYYDLRIEFSSITMRRALYKAPIAFLKLFLLHWK